MDPEEDDYWEEDDYPEGDGTDYTQFPACCGIGVNQSGVSDYFKDTKPGTQVGLMISESKITVEGWIRISGTNLLFKVNPFHQKVRYQEINRNNTVTTGPDIEKKYESYFLSPIYSDVTVLCTFLYYRTDVQYTTTRDKNGYRTGSQMCKVIYDIESHFVTKLQEAGSDMTVLVDLASEQIALNEPMVLKHGFELVTEFVNPKHGTQNRLYVRRRTA